MSFEPIFPTVRPELSALGATAHVVLDGAVEQLSDACGSDDGPVGELVVWAWVADTQLTRTLLVHHPRYGHWMPAGGRVGVDESPHAAVLRELDEETGLSGRLLDERPALLDVVYSERLDAPVRTFGMAFLVEADPDCPLRPEPGQQARWFDLGTMPEGASERHWQRLLDGLRSGDA